MMGYVKEVFSLVGAPVDFEEIKMDPNTDNYDDLNNAINSVKRNGCAIKANIETFLSTWSIASLWRVSKPDTKTSTSSLSGRTQRASTPCLNTRTCRGLLRV